MNETGLIIAAMLPIMMALAGVLFIVLRAAAGNDEADGS